MEANMEPAAWAELIQLDGGELSGVRFRVLAGRPSFEVDVAAYLEARGRRPRTLREYGAPTLTAYVRTGRTTKDGAILYELA